MPKNNKENILLEYLNIAFLAHKVKVLVIGGGEAAFIKSKTLASKGCKVTVVAFEFCDKFKDIKNINLIKDGYKIKYLKNNHFIIIAIPEGFEFEKIIKDCEKESKLYLNCADFKGGQFIIPSQDSTEEVNFSINIKEGNPKTALFLKGKVKEKLKDYDQLINYNNELRTKVKNSPYKKEIMTFAASEDFNFFIKNGVQNYILKMFYGGSNFEYKNSNEKK